MSRWNQSTVQANQLHCGRSNHSTQLHIVRFTGFCTLLLLQKRFFHAPYGPIWPYFSNIKFSWPPLQLIFLVRVCSRCNGYVENRFCIKIFRTKPGEINNSGQLLASGKILARRERKSLDCAHCANRC